MRWKSWTFPTDWVVVLAILLVALRPMGHRMVGKACFTNAMGLRAGAPVGFAGVDRGSAKKRTRQARSQEFASRSGHGIQPSVRTENSKRRNRFTRNRRHIGGNVRRH